ncbi:inactive receptor-like serine/threonine-protein kinase At2g40270 [Vicia villosa]|uniref:inactive receptor-like serine/threonine-protein kinase At2g40270 n=1 Tax=Vicia villosa TaxID=3911 RepID=UPI00273C8C78|nr:inactive receptor-like serine/threonine-protein kinase At2g40270 [Vicia villosa]
MSEAWRFTTFFCMVLIIGVVVSIPLTLNSQGLELQKMKEFLKWNGEERAMDPCLDIGQQRNIHTPLSRKLTQTSNSANSHKTNIDDHKNTLSPSSSPSSPPLSTPISPSSSLLSISETPSISPSPELSPSPEAAPTTSYLPFISSNPPIVMSTPQLSNWISAPSPSSSSNQRNSRSSNRKQHSVVIWSTVGGFSFLVLVSCTVFICFRSSKVVTVKPWTTGLSGQLRKAFITGIPSLKRAELVVACEDFSNIIGSLKDETIYKGTLSSGVEIAVVSSAVASSKEWSKILQAQFRNKIETLSRVNHKNFVNLIGYCEENKPFTRMMVFEYAPNGTLFEHLHIREAEQLDWRMRMRIAMGISYCLDHIHQLTPPIAHKTLLSSSIYLTEDYAAKISDLSFCTAEVDTKKSSEKTSEEEIKDNVYSFGVVLFELVTGKIPYAGENGFATDWAAEYIRGQPLRELVDTNLKSVKDDEIEKWSEVIHSCVDPDPEKRPSMKEVTSKLKEITSMEPDGATPKSSPLWWAEIEIMTSDLC